MEAYLTIYEISKLKMLMNNDNIKLHIKERFKIFWFLYHDINPKGKEWYIWKIKYFKHDMTPCMKAKENTE